MMEASDREVTLCGNAPTIRQFLFGGMSPAIFRAEGFRFFFFSREEAGRTSMSAVPTARPSSGLSLRYNWRRISAWTLASCEQSRS